METLDPIDTRLLKLLQQDASLTTAQLSERLHLSASQIGRRRARLEQEGLITGIHARISAAKTGLNVQAFIQVQMATHTADSHASFLRLTETQPQITAAWTLTGEADYLLRIYCTDLSDLNRMVQEILLPHPAVARVQSQIVMDQIKLDAPLPV
jgi:DNA-binding Lrp family transcriptional regulator